MTYSEQVQMSEMSLKQSRTNLYDKGASTPKECLYFPSLEAVSGEQCLQLREAHHPPDHRDLYAQNPGLALGGLGEGGGGLAFAGGSTSSFRGNGAGGSCDSERAYEVPFLVTKVRPITSYAPCRLIQLLRLARRALIN